MKNPAASCITKKVIFATVVRSDFRTMPTFGENFSAWITSLQFSAALPRGIELLNPYRQKEVQDVVRSFAQRFYNDNAPRIGIFGINPGRFGAGITGLVFTDPVVLRTHCGIENRFGDRRELSATFVYQTIDAFGGVEAFYRWFYLSALCPLGFTRDGTNLNFYDDRLLMDRAIPFIVESLRAQLSFPLRREVAIVVGSGVLHRIAERINSQHRFFDQLLVLEHPRYIMQYRRRFLADYIERYVCTYRQALTICNLTAHDS